MASNPFFFLFFLGKHPLLSPNASRRRPTPPPLRPTQGLGVFAQCPRIVVRALDSSASPRTYLRPPPPPPLCAAASAWQCPPLHFPSSARTTCCLGETAIRGLCRCSTCVFLLLAFLEFPAFSAACSPPPYLIGRFAREQETKNDFHGHRRLDDSELRPFGI